MLKDHRSPVRPTEVVGADFIESGPLTRWQPDTAPEVAVVPRATAGGREDVLIRIRGRKSDRGEMVGQDVDKFDRHGELPIACVRLRRVQERAPVLISGDVLGDRDLPSGKIKTGHSQRRRLSPPKPGHRFDIDHCSISRVHCIRHRYDPDLRDVGPTCLRDLGEIDLATR
jgi:hypothetical protein